MVGPNASCIAGRGYSPLACWSFTASLGYHTCLSQAAGRHDWPPPEPLGALCVKGVQTQGLRNAPCFFCLALPLTLDHHGPMLRCPTACRLCADNGVITLTSFISPYRADRDSVRTRMSEGCFLEIYMKVPIEICEQRDPKGLYKKARAGQLKNFTGVCVCACPCSRRGPHAAFLGA
jgi:hypothetical protein